jgi:hypothetical protein
MATANQTANQIKVWLFPTLVAILGTIIWNDVKEIKNDVKSLMAQSNIDKTRIDNIEKQIDFFRQGTKKVASLSKSPLPITPGPKSDDRVVTDLYLDTRQKKILEYVKKKPNTTA